ncbi:MAG: aminotransferase class I/II-fold pyridoxal phosphate-dependent enzyme [Microbacteriaceae bacterium]|nr:aminotransferase class I/II-fold pyridoxal phosphate-dependent enzyme [Microbacteriaceae bacterium]
MTVTGNWQRTARAAMLLGDDGELRQTIFAEMSGLAVRTSAINLGQGFPDEDGPPEVLEAAQKAIRDGINQYAPGIGMPVLRNAIAAHQERFYGLAVDPDREVMVTAGATEAIAATILALTVEGDEVLTLEPFYDSYAAIIGLSGAVHKTVPLRGPEFRLDPDELRAAVTDRTRLILVNDPHNPTGSILPKDHLQLLVELANEHDALIVTDEVYEHLVFEGAHVPIASLPGARECTISISSAGKTFSTTGWKIGWITAPAELIDAILAVKQFLTYTNGAPFQPAIAVGLGLADSYFADAASTLKEKSAMLSRGLVEAGFTVSKPEGGYFLVADAAPLGYNDADELCRLLPELAGVVAVPVTAFVHPERRAEYGSLLRFAYCKKFELLQRAADQLSSLKR